MSSYVELSSEDSEQEIVIKWARISSGKYEALKLLHHIPNGGSRNKKEAIKLKRMGVLAGVSDLHLPVAAAGYHGLYIEMKYGDGRISRSQRTFLVKAAYYNNFCAVCYTSGDAIAIIEAYLNPIKAFEYDNLGVYKDGRKIGAVSE